MSSPWARRFWAFSPCIIGGVSAIQANLIAFDLHDNSLCIIGGVSVIQASLIAFDLHDNSARTCKTRNFNKQYVIRH